MHAEFLLTLAEIAIAIAGFAGIVVAVLGSRVRTPEQEQLDMTLLKNVLAATFMALGFSLLPVTLLEVGVASTFTWRISSLTLAVVITTYTLFHLPTALRNYRQAGEGLPWTYVLNTIIAAVVATLNILSAIGKLPVTFYVLGPVYMIYAACFSFARVFFAISSRRAV